MSKLRRCNTPTSKSSKSWRLRCISELWLACKYSGEFRSLGLGRMYSKHEALTMNCRWSIFVSLPGLSLHCFGLISHRLFDSQIADLKKRQDNQSQHLRAKQRADEAAKRLQEDIHRIKTQKVFWNSPLVQFNRQCSAFQVV